eukprot:1357981-Prymnesium_polylepis.1
MPSIAPGQAFGGRGPRQLVHDISPVHAHQQRGRSQLDSILAPDAARPGSASPQHAAALDRVRSSRVGGASPVQPAPLAVRREEQNVPALRRTLERVVIQKDDKPDSPRLGEYRPSAQASWARERLLGASAPPVPEDEGGVEDVDARARRVQANAWYSQPT